LWDLLVGVRCGHCDLDLDLDLRLDWIELRLTCKVSWLGCWIERLDRFGLLFLDDIAVPFIGDS
jgi:hypothetical protein